MTWLPARRSWSVWSLEREVSLVSYYNELYQVFCGIDVARETHHAVALDSRGQRLVDRPLPNDEAQLRDLFGQLAAHGRILVVVDQPASIGALAIARACSCGVAIAYLPGLAMRRIADLYPGEGKTGGCQVLCVSSSLEE